MRAGLAFAISVTVVLGCGSVSGNKPDGGNTGSDSGMGDFSIAVAPDTISAPIGSQTTAVVTIERTGDVGDVTLTIQNLPTGVTGNFDNSPAMPGTATSNLTLTLGPGTTAGTSQITIVATAGQLERTATLALTATTITVTGKVASGAAGVTVGLLGKTSTTTDASGQFTFTDVTPPYDLYTVANGGFSPGVPTVDYYVGLTRPDPVVYSAQLFTKIIHPLPVTGTVAGTLGGAATSTDPFFVDWSTGGLDASTNTSSYSFTASWPSGATVTGQLYGLQWTTKSNGAPDTFRYGVTGNTQIASGTTNTVNVSLAVVTSAALTGNLTVPTGFPTPTITLNVLISKNTDAIWSTQTTQVDASVPVISTAKSTLFATSTAGNATTSYVFPALAAATDITNTMPAPATLTAPIDGAASVDHATQFMWTTPAMTVNEVTFSTGGSTPVIYNVFTTAGTTTIPMISEVALPGNASFSWQVHGYGPFTSIDEAATAAGLTTASATLFSGSPAFTTTSDSRTFTSAP